MTSPPVVVWALVLWAIGMCVLAPLVGIALRRSRRHLTGSQVIWDRNRDPWDRNPNGTYRLRAENSDGHLQAMDLDDVEQAFGPTTSEPPAEQDSA